VTKGKNGYVTNVLGKREEEVLGDPNPIRGGFQKNGGPLLKKGSTRGMLAYYEPAPATRH